MTRFVATTTTILLAISSAKAFRLPKKLYKPKPAGPQLTGTLGVESQSSTTPTYGGWIKFDVNVDGIPEDGKLPNDSKIVIQTICQQDFYDTVDIIEEYDGSGSYMFNLLDGDRNRGTDRPWKKYFSGLCQSKLLYQYRYQDLNDSIGEIDYHLANTKVYSISGTTVQHAEESS
jgi:hypothetical protein